MGNSLIIKKIIKVNKNNLNKDNVNFMINSNVFTCTHKA